MTTVLVPLAHGCEEIEAVTIIDILRRAGLEVVTAGLEAGPVTASRGVQLVPDTNLDEVLMRDFDMVALPGGAGGAERLQADRRIIELLQRMASRDRYTVAICAAPKVLATAGLLQGRQATSYPAHLDNSSQALLSEAPVVQDGRVITSRGPGTAIDFALTLVEVLCGRDKRDKVEAALQRP